MARKEGAGKKGVRCYRTACQTTIDVFYYNTVTNKYYCEDCAGMINHWCKVDDMENIVIYEKPDKFDFIDEAYVERIDRQSKKFLGIEEKKERKRIFVRGHSHFISK